MHLKEISFTTIVLLYLQGLHRQVSQPNLFFAKPLGHLLKQTISGQGTRIN